MTERNIAVVRKAIEAWNRRDLAGSLAPMHPDCELRPVQATETLHGHEGAAACFLDWFEAFEEYSMEPEDYIVDGERVLVPMVQRVRGKGSGLHLVERFYQLYTLREGKILRFDEYADETEALAALRKEAS
jgi:ketosteroid isomerase-like protein